MSDLSFLVGGLIQTLTRRHVRNYYADLLLCHVVRRFLLPIGLWLIAPYRRRGLRRKSHIFLFGMLVFMFSLSTVYWIISLYNDVNLITVQFVHEVPLDDTGTTHALKQGMPLMSALVLLNVSIYLL